jgi:hypothetical protein
LALAVPALAALAGAPFASAQPAATDDTQVAPAPPGPVDVATVERLYHAEPDAQKRVKLVQDMTWLPGAPEVLARIVESDPSDDVALQAAYAYRRVTIGGLAARLERRLVSGNRDAAARERLEREAERHQVFAAGQNLPHFIREAPPPFTVKTKDRSSVRALAFGDFGDDSDRQQRMAEAMSRAHAEKRFDLALTLGDNFYPAGMSGPNDPRWERTFDRLYGPMGVPFYPTFGNHDWVLADSPASEIQRAAKSAQWRMPADRYTFVAGPVQFFALDTNLITRAQLDWLDRELARSTARWKIVYGHHPIYSYGMHGDDPATRDNVLPLLRKRADLYLCGHDHDMQVLSPEDGVNFVIAGGGGAQPRPTTRGPRTVFAASKNGFAVVDATRSSLTVTLVGEDLQPLHKLVLRR